MKPWLVPAVRALGGILIAAGVLAVGVYVYGVIRVLGEPDRSWIFWGAVFLLGGLVLIQGGFVALLWARSLAAERERPVEPSSEAASPGSP